jgi:hypothetical protein
LLRTFGRKLVASDDFLSAQVSILKGLRSGRKVFGRIFNLKFWTNLLPKTTDTNLPEHYGQYVIVGFIIFKVHEVTITILNCTKEGFVRKFLPKRIHKIDFRSHRKVFRLTFLLSFFPPKCHCTKKSSDSCGQSSWIQ